MDYVRMAHDVEGEQDFPPGAVAFWEQRGWKVVDGPTVPLYTPKGALRTADNADEGDEGDELPDDLEDDQP